MYEMFYLVYHLEWLCKYHIHTTDRQILDEICARRVITSFINLEPFLFPQQTELGFGGKKVGLGKRGTKNKSNYIWDVEKKGKNRIIFLESKNLQKKISLKMVFTSPSP